MKKLCTVFIGTGFMLSLSVNASASNKKRSFNCQSDKKITVTLPEYTAQVTYIDGMSAHFRAVKNTITKNRIKKMTLSDEKARVEKTNGYITMQGKTWALAIAPEKERASLYSSNPDLNEIPMFCFSQDN